MKKRRLKRWVKDLIVISLLFVFVLCSVFLLCENAEKIDERNIYYENNKL